ncbi:MAG: thioredoxin family protein [Anaerolineales bacterium]|jgi:thioredoxin 1|nr:thioredoxin family protein [Anaerolineales bacterium]
MAEVLNINNETFESEVLQATLPVLVDFTAASCAACQNQDPLVAELAANEWDGKVKVVKLDTEKYPITASRCRVLGLPTLLLFKNGKEVARMTGFNPKKRLLEKIQTHLSN